MSLLKPSKLPFPNHTAGSAQSLMLSVGFPYLQKRPHDAVSCDVKTVTADSLQKGMAFGVPFSLTHVCSESFRPATHIPPAVVRDSTRVVIPFRPAVGKSKQASIARSLARSHCPRPASEAGTFRASVQHPRGATKRHPSGHWRALRCTAAHTATNGQARESVIYTSCEASESCVC